MSSPTIFVVGDSISMQYGPYLERSLASEYSYSRKSGEEGFVDLDNPIGANGGDSSMVADYLETAAGSGTRLGDWLVVNCGLHDIKTDPDTGDHQVDAGEYQSNLERILAAASRVAGRLVWVRTTPVVDEVHNSRANEFHRHTADQEQYNDIADNVFSDADIPIVDLDGFTRSLGDLPSLFCDHVHFTDGVQHLQGAYVGGWLNGHIRTIATEV